MLDKFRLKKNEKGFTLIELLIVVAIIGILAAIAIPQFAKYRQNAYNSSAQSDLKTMKTELEGYYVENFNYPPDSDEENSDPGEPVLLTGLTINVSNGVSAVYEGVSQWYAIATSHEGGNRAFGTAQNSTGLFYQEDVGATTVNFPASNVAASEDAWSDQNWDRL